MKKVFLVLVLMFSSAFAADFGLFKESIKPLMAAINASVGTRFSEPFVIPNYGVSFTAVRCEKYTDQWQKDWQNIKGMVSALGQTVKGLEPNELFSFHIIYACDFGNGDTQVTAQVKAATITKLDTWEVWVNGKKQ